MRQCTRPAIACFLLGVTMGGCTAANPVHDVITTRRVDLVDEAGNVLGRLGVDEEGSAGLFLLDSAGRNRAALIHDGTQTALYLFDDEETIRIGVAQFSHGGGGVALHGEASEGAAVLYLKDGSGSLTFYDEAGATVDRVPPAPAQDGAEDR